MANALALAAVTAVLRDLLNDGLLNANVDALGQLIVSALPPDRLEPDGANPANRLNVFLFHTSRNAALSNERLPGRDATGNRLANTFLALDLHYLLTATGSEELNAEVLLGYGMQVLHENAILSRAAIRTALGGASPVVDSQILPPALRLLAATELADQIEQIRITPMVPDPGRPDQIEVLSNLWSAFSAPLRPSALFTVSAVLIEARRPARVALPVVTLGGRTAQIRNPTIERVQALPGGIGTLPSPTGAVLPGGVVALSGTAMAAADMRIFLGDRVLVVPPTQIGDRRIDLSLPADARAGVARLMIEHRFTPEGGGPSRLWESSNAFAFLVQPQIQTVARRRQGNTVNGFNGTLTVTLTHPVDPLQRVEFLLNPLPGGTVQPLTLPVRPLTAAGPVLVADLTAVPTGRYLVRVSVDGAISIPATNAQGFSDPVAVLT